MSMQAVEDYALDLVDLGDAREETKQVAPVMITIDSIWMYMGYRLDE